MSEQLALLPGYLTAHLQLALLALAIGFAISVPAGVWVSGRPRLEQLVLGLAGLHGALTGKLRRTSSEGASEAEPGRQSFLPIGLALLTLIVLLVTTKP